MSLFEASIPEPRVSEPGRCFQNILTAVLVFGAAITAVASPPGESVAPADEKTIRGFLSTYCYECHGPDKQKGDRRFDRIALSEMTSDTLIELQEIIDALNLGAMPPEEADQHPDAETVKTTVDHITRVVADERARLASTGGRTVLRRLNRREYLNTVGDLFGLNMTLFDPATNFPRDNVVEHLDNVGDSLRMSGFLLAQYLEAADQVVEKAFRERERPPEQTWRFDGNFRSFGSYVAGKVHQYRYLYLEQLVSPIEHRLGYGFLEEFREGVPADGWYEIRIKAEALHRENPYDPRLFGRDPEMPFRLGIVAGNVAAGELTAPQPIEPLLGEVVMEDDELKWYTFRIWLDRGYTPRFTFQNGTVKVARAVYHVLMRYRDSFPADLPRRQIGDNHVVMWRHGQFPQIRIHEVQIRGPLIEQWPTEGRRAILGDEPFTEERTREILKNFADRAYRRPARPEEVETLMQVVAARRQAGDTPFAAMMEGLKAVLCSPAFLYLAEPEKETDQLSAHELASRLSYFLWSTMPDDELRKEADSGELLQPEALAGQVRRMLQDPRSDVFVASFLDSWLNLRTLGDMMPAKDAFQIVYTENLLPAMKKETQLITRDLIDRNASVVNFIDSEYTFMNRPLAHLYGMAEEIEPENGHKFRRVALNTPRRGGLLGQASVLTVSANGIETSPVTRGVWVLENLLGTPPNPPPDDVPAIDPDTRGATTVREVLARHRNTPACNDCHRKIDPPGFALENFDPVGQWRDEYENGAPVDAAGELPGGQAFEDVAGLKKLLIERKDQFVRALTRQLLSYACGRRMEPLDRPEIDRILETTKKDNYRFRDILEQVVLSETFRSK